MRRTVNFSTVSQFVFRGLVILSIAATLPACDRNAAALASLKADNERLRAEIANLRRKGSGGADADSTSGKPDHILGINELWSQRFEDNEFRSRQRLTDKVVRVTGILDNLSAEGLSIYGVGKSRNAQLSVILEKNFAAKIPDGLAALEKGITITVQGKFKYDRMELHEAAIVDKATGMPMSSEQLQAFGQVGPNGGPVPPPLPENQ